MKTHATDLPTKPSLTDQMTEADDLKIQRGIDQDPDAAEVTDAEMASFRPAAEMLPKIFGEEAAQELMRRRGRPAQAVTKEAVNVRYDRDLLDAFRAGGDGWQTRMNSALREWAAQHGMLQN